MYRVICIPQQSMHGDCIIKYMLDSSNNFTLEEIDFDDEEEQISGIHEIKYQQDYEFLGDFSFNTDHLNLTNIKVEPPMQACWVEFYQDLPSNNTVIFDQQNARDGKFQKKIAALILRDNNSLKLSIKLPCDSQSIFLKVTDKQNEMLIGQLSKKEGESQIELFDGKGNQKGILFYHMKVVHASQQAIRADTLHENEFLQQMEAIKREVISYKTPSTEKKADSTKKDTVNESIQSIRSNDKVLQGSSQDDGEDAHSQKSEIDYLGYNDSARIFADYRIPIQRKQKTPKQQIKKFNYQSIKRSLNHLGLNNHSQIQTLLQRQREQFMSDSPLTTETKKQSPSLGSSMSPPLKASFKDESSQAQDIKPYGISFGVGTYSPLLRLHGDIDSSLSKYSKHSPPSRQFKQLGAGSFREESQRECKQNHLPRTILSRPQPVESFYEHVAGSKEKYTQLSMRQRIYGIKLNQNRLKSRNDSLQSRRQDRKSCKESPSCKVYPSESQSDSVLYPKVDICVNNLSVNFNRKTFGAKVMQLSVASKVYSTQALIGNNLIWVGKKFMFKSVDGNDSLCVALKQASQEQEHDGETLAQVNIDISDLFLNIKKSYFQTFLLSKKEVVAILIVGFQILRKDYNQLKKIFPLKITRQTHIQSQLNRSKTTKQKRNGSRPQKKEEKYYDKNVYLPQARVNPIRVKKYQGCKNIKIGRASRFVENSQSVPGHGDYFIKSQFNRYALKGL